MRHFFIGTMKHKLAFIAHERAYSMELSLDSNETPKGKWFVCAPFAHCGRDVSVVKSYVDLTTRLLSAISNEVMIDCCGEATTVFNKALDIRHGRKAVAPYPFSLNFMQIELSIHRYSFSILGLIDTFSMLQSLLLGLRGLLNKRWVQLTQSFEGYI